MGHIMLLSRPLTHKSVIAIRISSSSRYFRTRTLFRSTQPLRRNSSSTRATAIPSRRKPILPERLLVFHAGTARAVFLGCLKISTIFIFSFFCLVVAPAHFQSEEQPKWVAPAVVISGIIPMAFVGYVTSPFVAHIHLRLPTFARYSQEMVVRYSQALPKDAKIEFTTVNFIGMPRVTRLSIADLKPAQERLGIVNYIRDMDGLNTKRPWWMGSAVRKFGVHGGVRITQGSDVWENIAKAIAKRSS